MTLTVGSLFSGGGGLDIAVCEAFGGEVAWHCEVDPAAVKVLAHHWPTVRNLGDITKVDWAAVPRVHVMCGGFPCQDVSAAGKRAGLKRGTRTGLWHHTAHAIGVLRPRWAVLENVLGLLSADGDEWPETVVELSERAAKWGRVVSLIQRKVAKADRRGTLTPDWLARKDAELVRARREEQRAKATFTKERLRLVPRAIATVLAALAVKRYDVGWFVCKASDVGAPHHRTRVFILASREPWTVPAGARQIARLDDDAWTEPDHGLFGTIPFSGRWPHAGCIVDGVAYEVDTDRVTQEISTAELLPTPTTQPMTGNGHARHLGGEVRDMLPTPTVGNATGTNERRGGARGDEMLLPGVAVAAARGELTDPVLPTPVAHPSGNTPENHLRKKPGRKVVTDLAILVENDLIKSGGLLPTPTASDADKARDNPAQAARHSPPLSAVTAHFPTPTASDHKGQTRPVGRTRADGRARTEGDQRLPDAVAVLPTPRAAEAHQSMTVADGNGGLSEVLGVHMFPTPSAADGNGAVRDLAHAGPDYARAGRPNSGGDDLATAVDRAARGRGTDWGKYAPAIDRWTRSLGRSAPAPTEPNSNGKPRLAARFAEWMMGWPDGWVTDPAIGISRNDQLRIIGNGVCPQQSANALRWLIAVVAESLGAAS